MNLKIQTVSFAAGKTGTFKGAERVLVKNTDATNSITVAGQTLLAGATWEWSVPAGDKIEFDYATGSGAMSITFHNRAQHHIGSIHL